MEEQGHQNQKTESGIWAAHIMRMLAMTGLVSVLALVAWLVVQGVRYVPNAGEGVTALVSSITSIFRSAPEESVRFDLPSRSFEAYEEATIAWNYTGPLQDPSAQLRFGCDSTVTLRIYSEGSWKEPTCDEWTSVDTSSARIVPMSPTARYADVGISVRIGTVSDETVITIVNATPSSTTSTSTTSVATTTSTSSTTTTASKPSTGQGTISTLPRPTVPVVTQPVRVAKPADLAINIEETGVYLDVANKRTFFPVSPIPSDKRAGVVFTVTNTGETASALWSFTIHVPTADDPSYVYKSALQEPLQPGMQVEFTLGFDELPEKGKGTVRAELITLDKSDPSGNNTDAVSVTFK